MRKFCFIMLGLVLTFFTSCSNPVSEEENSFVVSFNAGVLKNVIDNLNNLINFVNAKLDENTKQLINQYLMNVFSELLYTEENENLTFNFDLISEDGTHVYNDENMTIK